MNLKCIQINLQHCIAAVSELCIQLSDSYDLAFIQEPYCISNRICAFPTSYKIVYSCEETPLAAIIIMNKDLPVIYHEDVSNKFLICIEIGSGINSIIVISVYCAPSLDISTSLEYLMRAITKFRGRRVIVGGDFNAHSSLWDEGIEDARGEAMLEFICANNLFLQNIYGYTTYESTIGRSCIDLTLSNGLASDMIKNWIVLDIDSLSDHKYVQFYISNAVDHHKSSRKFVTRKADWKMFEDLLKTSLNDLNATTINNEHDARQYAKNFILSVNHVCEKTIPVQNIHHRLVPWWTSELSKLRKENNRFRRIYQQTRNSVIRQINKEVYLKKQKEYKDAIKESKRNSWKRFCTESSRNPWGFVYKMCTDKLKTPRCFSSLRTEDGYTNNIETTVTNLMDSFFPDDNHSEDNTFQTGIRQSSLMRSYSPDTPDDPQFTLIEVQHAINRLIIGKAPGNDRITTEIVQKIFLFCPLELTDFYNICLNFGIFPAEWKQALVVVVPKTGNIDLTNINSYRPISLLPLLGKILDRLMIERINWYFGIKNLISDKQFGFTRQKSAEDALAFVVQSIRAGLTNHKYVTAISLDIKGAFNHAWWPMILHKLRIAGCPKNLYYLAADFFNNRSASLSIGTFTVTKRVYRGCPQGSVSGPNFWNILFNDFLVLDKGEGITDIAFADDSLIIFAADSRSEIENRASTTLEIISDWSKKYKLCFNPKKTKSVIFTAPYKPTLYRRTPTIRMQNQSISVTKSMKYLGVILDHKLLWVEHVLLIKKKSIQIFNKLATVARSKWGLDGEALRLIYNSVFSAIMTYGCNVWAEATTKKHIQKHLFTTQRLAALRMTKAYRTTSFDALCVLARILPVDLLIQQKTIHYRIRRGWKVNIGNLEYEQGDYETDSCFLESGSPWEKAAINAFENNLLYDCNVYTDGSRSDEGVAAAFVVFHNNGSQKHAKGLKLNPKCSIFQAELFAVFKSIVWCCENMNDKNILIYCDSKAVITVLQNAHSLNKIAVSIKTFLKCSTSQNHFFIRWVKAHIGVYGNEKADQLAKQTAVSHEEIVYNSISRATLKSELLNFHLNEWQNRWNTSTKGRLTYEFFPNVSVKFPHVVQINFISSQFFSGHGCFRKYLHRFNLLPDSNCLCGEGEEDVEHIIFKCSRFDYSRRRIEYAVRRKGITWPCPMKTFIDDYELYHLFSTFLSTIWCETINRSN